ncbi:MAG: S9 family peptidase [Verrucomicrobia bacterium]|nr:S9 family peptidase [Verrucomicrobiota bacterium]
MLVSLCRKPGWILAAGLVVLPLAAAEDATAARIARLFAPFRTDAASLSPDGKHLAYSLHENGTLALMLVALGPNKARQVAVSADYVEPMSGNKEKLPSRLTYLRWKSATRLVFSVDDNIIWAINADGTEPRRLIAARDVRTDWQEKRERNPGLTREGRGGGGGGQFSRRPNTPDMAADTTPPTDPLGGSLSEEDAAAGVAGLPSADTADVFGAFALAWNTDRHPVVAELLEDDPDNILVEARSNTGLLDDAVTLNGAEMSATLFRVNVRTGRSKPVEDIDAAGRLVPDRSGQPRLALHFFNTERRLDYFTGKRWQQLDAAVPALAAAPFRLTPENFLGRHSFPLGFDRDTQRLYFASNADRDTYGIYCLNLQTGLRTDLAIEHQRLDLADPGDALRTEQLVYDRAGKKVVGVRMNAPAWPTTAWFDPELNAVQQSLERGAQKSVVQILEWDAKRENILVHLAGENDPGAFMIFRRAEAKLQERARCAPELTPEVLNRSLPFSFDASAGRRLSGVVTYPRSPRLTPPPVLIYFHDGPWGRDVPGFNRGAQALATMGFAVVQVNYRGSGGFGLQHLAGTKTDFDRAAVDDALAALDFLAGQMPLSRRLVAALGTGYGGYLALRAVQLHPEKLRAAVALNAPTDLPVWINQQPEASTEVSLPAPDSFRTAVRRALFGTQSAQLKAMSPLTHAATVKAPVLLIHGAKDQIVPPTHSLRMRNALQKAGATVSHLELPSEGHANWRPNTSTRVFREIEMFLNEHIYNYAVRTGEPTVVPEKIGPEK